MVMTKDIITTKKPWVLLVFVLMAINAVVALTAAFGIAGNPLNALATQPGGMLMTGAIAPSADTTAFNLAGLLLLALDVIILYGLWQGHVWSWYLLMFTTAASIVTALLGAVSGTAVDFIPLIISVVMLAALVKREVIDEYKPDLKIIPAQGVW
jgi:hypothetical protein